MEPSRLLSCLDTDVTRLRQVAARNLSAPVPSCPEWTVDQLAQHVALVYLHKVECMRTQRFPESWPPDVTGEPTLALLDRSYAELTEEFATRKPEEPSATWYEPEQTVGFWIRRMAQETVIHRVDAELALGEPLAPIPDDLAIDGIDEVLQRFLDYGSHAWREDFEVGLPADEQPPVVVHSGGKEWLVRVGPDGVSVRVGGGNSAATISGEPAAVLLWLWRRADGGVQCDGDQALVEQLRKLLGDATQ